MTRMFTPRSRRWVAKEWRRLWGLAFLRMPALPRAAAKARETGARAVLPPVAAEGVEELLRKHDVAVLAPLALIDADRHAVAVDVRGPQVEPLVDAETGGVERHEDRAVLQVGNRVEEREGLLGGEDDRELPPGLLVGDPLHVEAAGEDVVVEEPDRADVAVEGVVLDASLLREVELVLLHVLEREPVGGQHEVPYEALHVPEVVLPGALGEPAHAELAVHEVAELGHRDPPVGKTETRRRPRRGPPPGGWWDAFAVRTTGAPQDGGR